MCRSEGHRALNVSFMPLGGNMLTFLYKFCDYCGDGGDLVTCSAPECAVTVCVSKDATKCITWDAPKDAPWFCVQHNMRQAQFIKVCLPYRRMLLMLTTF